MFIECCDLKFKYPQSKSSVLNNICFKLDKPGFHSLFGPSGVGKTSFAKILASQINEFTGKLYIKKNSLLFYTYNQERLPGWSSIKAHLDKITVSSKKLIKDQLIEIFDMQECMNKKFSQLSLGQQNRINLIRYLVQDFDLLIMDESLANVDEILKENIILKIKEMFPDKFFLYISHNLIEVSKFSNQILVFRSSEKSPQIKLVCGLDIYKKEKLDKKQLDSVLLKIMNAY